MAANIFGGLGGLLGQGLPSQFTCCSNSGSLDQVERPPETSTGATLTIDCGSYSTAVPQQGVLTGITEYGDDPQTKETAVAWLDRRVEEMRVRL